MDSDDEHLWDPDATAVSPARPTLSTPSRQNTPADALRTPGAHNNNNNNVSSISNIGSPADHLQTPSPMAPHQLHGDNLPSARLPGWSRSFDGNRSVNNESPVEGMGSSAAAAARARGRIGPGGGFDEDDHVDVPMLDINGDADEHTHDTNDATIDDAYNLPHQQKQLWRLYCSHLLSSWGDRMWQFAVSLFMINIWPSSLLMTAVYGLTSGLLTVLCGPIVGDYVDRAPRLRIMRLSLAIQNTTIVLSVILILILLHNEDVHDGKFWFLVVLIIALGSISELASLAGTLSVEKDWVVVITNNNEELLAHTNSVLRRIDLACKILAPILVGLTMTFAGTVAGAILIGVWNIASAPPEYILLNWVYRSYPELHHREAKPRGPIVWWRTAIRQFVVLRDGWKVYWMQDVAWAGIALALLYCTVLSFGSLMTGYAYYRGLSEAILSVGRGFGAAFGIGATFLFAPVRRVLGLVNTGVFSIMAQLTMLCLCMVSTYYGASSEGDCHDMSGEDLDNCRSKRNLEMGLLLSGVILSRLGLWMFDLSVTQLLQQRVPEAVRGTINGTQNALQSIFDVLGMVLGIILSDPSRWEILVFISFGFVAVACISYIYYAMRAGDEGTRESYGEITNEAHDANLSTSEQPAS
eukprot:m.138064 g.138064  ORF g.138064 m.138064 type:complete len:639 (+) comp16624_c0_seq1:173-2089(+)